MSKHKNLKQIRRSKGWDQAELATRAGVSHATVSAAERGKLKPTSSKLYLILQALGLEVNPDNPITALRIKLNKNQAEFAEAMGVTQSEVSRLENGKLALAGRYKVKFDHLQYKLIMQAKAEKAEAPNTTNSKAEAPKPIKIPWDAPPSSKPSTT